MLLPDQEVLLLIVVVVVVVVVAFCMDAPAGLPVCVMTTPDAVKVSIALSMLSRRRWQSVYENG